MSRYAIANGIRRYFGSKSLIAINEFLYVVKYRWNKMPIDENIREVKQDKNHATSVVWVSVDLMFYVPDFFLNKISFHFGSKMW